jgi:hypothetical protein
VPCCAADEGHLGSAVTRLAVGAASGIVSCWDVRKGALLAAAHAHQRDVTCCTFDSYRDTVVSCGQDGFVSLLQVRAAGPGLGQWGLQAWACGGCRWDGRHLPCCNPDDCHHCFLWLPPSCDPSSHPAATLASAAATQLPP